jgi:hypothetical protein
MEPSVDMRLVRAWCDDCQRSHDGYERGCPSYRPPVDWSKMRPVDILEALQTAPNIAEPWDDTQGAPGVRRDGRRRGSWIAFDAPTKTNPHQVFVQPLLKCFDDRATADAALLAAGWLLVEGPITEWT